MFFNPNDITRQQWVSTSMMNDVFSWSSLFIWWYSKNASKKLKQSSISFLTRGSISTPTFRNLSGLSLFTSQLITYRPFLASSVLIDAGFPFRVPLATASGCLLIIPRFSYPFFSGEIHQLTVCWRLFYYEIVYHDGALPWEFSYCRWQCNPHRRCNARHIWISGGLSLEDYRV